MPLSLEVCEHYVKHYRHLAKGISEVQGLYDLSKVPFKLGNILLFSHNLRTVQQLTAAKGATFAFVTDRGFTNRSLSTAEWPAKSAFAGRLISLYRGVEFQGDAPPSVERISFPLSGTDWDHKSYLFPYLAERETGRRVPFEYIFESPKAKGLIQRSTRPVLCFHPKYDQRVKSNALLPEWAGIVSAMSSRFQCVVIGDDKYPEDFRTRVKENGGLFSQDLGLDIFDESYLIHHGRGFLGIASGPSNFAILSDTPYLIVKHPEDAWAEGFQEVVDDRLPMATAGQHFHIGKEDSAFVREKVRQWL